MNRIGQLGLAKERAMSPSASKVLMSFEENQNRLLHSTSEYEIREPEVLNLTFSNNEIQEYMRHLDDFEAVSRENPRRVK